MNKDIETYLKSVYFKTSHPASFSGLDKLHKFVKKEGKFKLSKGLLRKWLTKHDAYSSHKPVIKNFKRERVIVDKIDRQWDIDTISMLRYSMKMNSGYKYILVMIDILSRYVWTYPLKTLTGKEMVNALKAVFKKNKPITIRSDMGTEMLNRYVREYLERLGIHHFTTRNMETKANYCERVIKTLKQKITRYMTHRQTHEWVSILEDIVKSYNNTYHRSIHMTPTKARQMDSPTLWKLQYSVIMDPTHFNFQPYKFKVGDKVKIAAMQDKFQKEYDRKWTHEIFIISSRKKSQGIAKYTLKMWNDKPIDGRFYEQELQKVQVNAETEYKIEKIIKKRKRNGIAEYLVHWQGWDKSHRSWIPQSAVHNI